MTLNNLAGGVTAGVMGVSVGRNCRHSLPTPSSAAAVGQGRAQPWTSRCRGYRK